MTSKTMICPGESSETKIGGEECPHDGTEEIVISDVSMSTECEVEESGKCSSEESIRIKRAKESENRSETQSETQEEEKEICEAESKSAENSLEEGNLTENEEIELETESKTEDVETECKTDDVETECKTDDDAKECKTDDEETEKDSKTDDEVEREDKTDEEVEKECKTDEECEKECKTDEEGEKECKTEDETEKESTDDETLIGNIARLNTMTKVVSDQDEDSATQGSVSKSEESQLQESFGENMDEDADSEAGGESDETEVDVDERERAEERCSRETSPTPCPPESPSESAAPMSVASTPDMRREGGDVMSSSSGDIKHELMLKLDGEINKDSLFQQRFFILASNYDEMIKMKDEYKAENERLRMENMQMKMENTRIYTEKLESRERENHKLHQTVDFLKRDLAETQSKLRTANDDYKSLCLSYEEKILRLVQNLSVAEETLADTVFKLREQEHVRSRHERENRRQCERLQKEKNDLMELALSGDRNNFYLS